MSLLHNSVVLNKLMSLYKKEYKALLEQDLKEAREVADLLTSNLFINISQLDHTSISQTLKVVAYS